MKQFFRKIKKKKWALGTLLLFFVVFWVFDCYEPRKDVHAADYKILDSEGLEITGEYELRRATDTFSLDSTDGADTWSWSSSNTEIMEIDPAMLDSSGTGESRPNLREIKVNVKNIGKVALNCTITHPDGSTETKTVTLNVVFSVNEFLNSSAASMVRVFDTDTRHSIVMDYNSVLYFGSSATQQLDRLNLIFGDATSNNAVWTSGNSDVIRVNSNASEPMLMAVGAGKTTLSVLYHDGANDYTDSIDVYVRPRIYKDNANGEEIGSNAGASGGSSIITMENNDKFYVSALFNSNPLEGILDKVTWVVAKRGGTTRTLVRDSLGNIGEDGEDVNLIFDSSTGNFRLNAKAGQYVILFYIKGTYTGFSNTQTSRCDPVFFNVDVSSNFDPQSPKTVNLNIGGSYDLSEAFNISRRALLENFDIIDLDTGSDCISVDMNQMIVHGENKGTASFGLKCKRRPAETIPGVNEDDIVKVNITVTDTFSLNVSSTTMAVGSKLSLNGIIGSGTYTDNDTFRWECSDTSETYISMSASGQYATVTAKRPTPLGNFVTVTLYWTDEDAVTRVASCRIYVSSSATTITLDHTSLEMEVGDVEYLDSGLKGDQNLVWISSNSDIVKVEAQPGNTQAKITAGKETGTAIITVINKDNNAYTTCLVTVTAAISSLTIDQGNTIDTVLSEGFVQLTVSYEPKNATNTKLVWSSSDESVATVDENGLVTLLKEETVWISVEPAFNPNNLVERCCINIKYNPVTAIELEETSIEMIAGDMYTVNATVVPEDASNTVLEWASDNEEVATVEGGVIVAAGPGNANITVANGNVFRIIKVHVRNRLESISFTQDEYEIKEGTTASLKEAVIFNPDTEINTNLSWSSSNDSVVSVDDDGNITGLSSGDAAWITCVAEDLGVTHAISCLVKVIDSDVEATGLDMVPAEATMYVGDTLQLTAQFTPATTTYRTVTWFSENEDIATVDDQGVVTAVNYGEVTIEAVYENPYNGEIWRVDCALTVYNAIQSMDFDQDEYEIKEGSTISLMDALVFSPAEGVDKTVSWTSTNDSVVSVDENGNITGMTAGDTAWITCVSRELGPENAITCAVHVIDRDVEAESFEITPTQAVMYAGETLQITAVFTPATATYQTVMWSTSNEAVATVDENGLVTGVAEGNVIIGAVYQNPIDNTVWDTLYCEITVYKARVAVEGVALDPATQEITIGSTCTVTPVFTPSDATDTQVTFQSSDDAVATVDEKGLVTGVASGSAVIICRTHDGGFIANSTITVIPGVKITLNKTYRELALNKSFKLKATITPESVDKKDLRIEWQSSDDGIAKVANNGKQGTVTAYSKGTCKVTCSLPDYGVSAACEVKTGALKTTVKLNKTSIRMGLGQTYKLKATVTSNNSKLPSLKWTTSNKKIATVTQKGKIKAKKIGYATITATSKDKIKAKANKEKEQNETAD